VNVNATNQRVHHALASYYVHILGQVDALATARGAKPLTEECGAAYAVGVAARFVLEAGGSFNTDDSLLVAALGEHVYDEHGEYLAFSSEVACAPRTQACVDQLIAAATEVSPELARLARKLTHGLNLPWGS
jgi:hypothetical protein